MYSSQKLKKYPKEVSLSKGGICPLFQSFICKSLCEKCLFFLEDKDNEVVCKSETVVVIKNYKIFT